MGHMFQTQHCGDVNAAMPADQQRTCQLDDRQGDNCTQSIVTRNTSETCSMARAADFAAAIDRQSNFHCFFKNNTSECYCTCSAHPACVARQGTTLRNQPLLGNHWHGVIDRQDCCNMCTNHPRCDTYTYVHAELQANRQCVMYEGSAMWTIMSSTDPAYNTTYSGCESGVAGEDC